MTPGSVERAGDDTGLGARLHLPGAKLPGAIEGERVGDEWPHAGIAVGVEQSD
jgi:hypothetical protein